MKTTINSQSPAAGGSGQGSPVPAVIQKGIRALRKKLLCAGALALALLPAANGQAANIVWVSDANDPATGFFPAGSGYTDSGFVTLLQNAGHNVIRYNQPNAQATLLTAAELIALNTNDLIVMSRAVNSGALQTGQGNQWNTNIFKPLIDLSAFHARNNRLGWFTLNEAPDATPMNLSAVLTGNPSADAIVDYLFGGVAMNGTNTIPLFDEPIDRNSTPVLGVPVAGGTTYARATYVQENSGATPTINSGTIIAGFPAGTVVRGTVDILGGYRMFFSAGSRESATAPNAIPLYTGRENLTAAGEDIFLRAVQVALNNGVAPAIDPATAVGFVTQPLSVTVPQAGSFTLSVSVTGAAPRTIQWQRDSGDGVFFDIPDGATTFSKSSITLTNVGTDLNGVRFRVSASNPINGVVSDEAVITVTPDTEPPVVLFASSVDGTNVTVRFNELLEQTTAENTFGYVFANGPSVAGATLLPDRRTVNLVVDHLTGPPLPASFSLIVSEVADLLNQAIPLTGVTVSGNNFGLTSADVGSLNPAGSSAGANGNTFELTGGGTVIAGTADQLRFAYKTVEGDFDAKVRVASLTGTWDHLESTAKAVLAARETTDTAAGNVTVYLTPLAPSDDSVGTTVRTNAAGATGNLGPVVTPGGLPGGWLRITRVGNAFATYRSANGTDWTALGSINLNYGPSMLVGPGVNSHRAARTVTGTFSDFSVTLLPRLGNVSYGTGGAFSGTVTTEAGKSYRVEYKNQFSDAEWQLLTTIEGDGTAKPFTDNTPDGSHRFYRVVIP